MLSCQWALPRLFLSIYLYLNVVLCCVVWYCHRACTCVTEVDYCCAVIGCVWFFNCLWHITVSIWLEHRSVWYCFSGNCVVDFQRRIASHIFFSIMFLFVFALQLFCKIFALWGEESIFNGIEHLQTFFFFWCGCANFCTQMIQANIFSAKNLTDQRSWNFSYTRHIITLGHFDRFECLLARSFPV